MELTAIMTTATTCWTAACVIAIGMALAAQTRAAAIPDQTALETMTARFAPMDITADVTGLPASERQVLGKLVQASSIMDAVFLRQVWAGNEAMLMRL